MSTVRNGYHQNPSVLSPESLAHRLMKPSVLDGTLRSGLFIARPADRAAWSAWKVELERELHALGGTVLALMLPGEAPGDAESRLRLALEAAMAHGQECGQIDNKPACRGGRGAGLSKLITEFIDLRRANLVLILDGVDLLSQEQSVSLLCTLKAARDAVNLDPRSEGTFFLIAAGADSFAMRQKVLDYREPFFCAEFAEFIFG